MNRIEQAEKTLRDKRIQARKDRAVQYERIFGKPLVDRMSELLQLYPNVASPNWISWEGHKYTNAATSHALKTWISDLQS